jgi:hypothetical protein
VLCLRPYVRRQGLGRQPARHHVELRGMSVQIARCAIWRSRALCVIVFVGIFSRWCAILRNVAIDGGLEVDEEIKLRRLLDRQIARPRPLQNSVHVGCGSAKQVIRFL